MLLRAVCGEADWEKEGQTSSLGKNINKRGKQVPTLLWDWLSSYLANVPPGLWKAGLWGRQHSCGFGLGGGCFVLFLIVCFVPYLHVLVWHKLDVMKHNGKSGRSQQVTDVCPCRVSCPQPSPAVFNEGPLIPHTLWFLSVLALRPFGPAKLSPREGSGRGKEPEGVALLAL